MGWFPSPSNVNDPVSWMEYANNVTSLTDTSGNVIMSGIFGTGILLTVFLGFFMGFSTFYEPEKSLLASLFISFLISIFMYIMGMVNDLIVTNIILLVACGVMYVIVKGR